MNAVGYTRVSTEGQATDGVSPEAQQAGSERGAKPTDQGSNLLSLKPVRARQPS